MSLHILNPAFTRKILGIAGLILGLNLSARATDSIPSGFKMSPEWKVGAEVINDYVLGTDPFLRGQNVENKSISFSSGGLFRAAFSFNPESKEGRLYPRLYQGVAIGCRTFYHNSLLGTPGSAFVFQGAPFKSWGDRLHLCYEWDFGIAFGWNHKHNYPIETSSVISTAVTAHMGVALKLNYELSDHFTISCGLSGTHFSNGNTSWRNAGLNSAGITLGLTYIVNPLGEPKMPTEEMKEDADRKKWFYDIMAFGSWRQRLVYLPNTPEIEYLVPGKYPVVGLQFAPAIRLNRWVAIGPALDMQWDKSADLESYWRSEFGVNNLKFHHVPFEKQISCGLSAHAELTAPIFSVNAGVGFNIINPKGERAFYQSLTVKTFLTRHLYLNVGYRLGAFKNPHNIMLGVGYRLE